MSCRGARRTSRGRSRDRRRATARLGREDGGDLLLETPNCYLPPRFEDTVFQLTGAGLRITLAHPERNPSFQSQPERLAELVRRGALVQLTASSLARAPGRSATARLARRLLRDGLAHVLASDSHGVGAYDRASLSEGLAAARALVGARADQMVTGAPAALLAGGPLPAPPEPERAEPVCALRRLLSRRR